MGEFHDSEFGNGFLDMIPKAQAAEAKIDKVDYSELRHSRGNTQHGERSKGRMRAHICKAYICYEVNRLMSRVYKELLQLVHNKNNQI